MSPTEHELRAALSDGEGDPIDVGRIIAGGRALRARRRSQLLSTAAVTVLVGGLAFGGVALFGGSGTAEYGSSAGKAAGGAFGSASGPNDAEKRPGGSPAAAAPRADAGDTAAGRACPAAPPRYLPGGSTAGADATLFSRPVASLVVCSYDRVLESGASVAPQQPARVEFSGAQATAIVDSLEKAPRTRPAMMCPDIRSADRHTLLFLGFAADGSSAGSATTTTGAPACAVQVTNGRTTRFDWTPPAVLQQALAGLPGGHPSHGPVVQGSPTNS